MKINLPKMYGCYNNYYLIVFTELYVESKADVCNVHITGHYQIAHHVILAITEPSQFMPNEAQPCSPQLSIIRKINNFSSIQLYSDLMFFLSDYMIYDNERHIFKLKGRPY